MEIIIIAIISAMLAYILYYKTLQWYYTKRSNLTTFVVRFKNRTTYYIDLTDKITKDELLEIIERFGAKEEIIGVYNLLGEELEYVKGLWVEK